MKSTRQNDIIRIISDREIEKQEELAGELRALGYQVTQATISRDIKDLHLIKVIGESGKYKYAQPDRNRSAVNVRLTRILSDSLVSVEQAGYMIVVKTLSGSAGVAAEAIDTMQWSGYSEQLPETIPFSSSHGMKRMPMISPRASGSCPAMNNKREESTV